MTAEDTKKIREMMEFLIKDKISDKVKKMSVDERKVYELTGRKREDIQRETGFAAGKIYKIWIGLEERGILIKDGKSYRKII